MATRDYDDIVQVSVFCDECEGTISHDYKVPAGEDSLDVARRYLANNEGWLITPRLDLCADCKP